MTTDITVRVLKYNGTEHRRWKARLRSREAPLIVLDAEFEEEVQHESLGTIPKGTRTIEYYWLNRWYNVFQFLKEDGSTRLWYGNIATPPSIQHDELTYIDLDIDVLVQPNHSFSVLDVDDFRVNAKLYGYSEETRRQALDALKALERKIKARDFPFANETVVSSGANR